MRAGELQIFYVTDGRKPVIKTMERSQKTALLAVLLGAFVMICSVFVPPVTGSADNGELVPVIEGNGLYKLDHGEKDEYFSYAAVKYGINQYHTEAKPVFSSRNLFIQAAKALNFLLAKDKTIFDIRFYGILLCIYTLAGLYLFVEYAAGRFPEGGILTALAAVFIFCDTAYLTWIMSFYEESVIYPSLLMMLSCVLRLSDPSRSSAKMLGLFFASSLLCVTVNNRTMLWGTLAGGLCILILYGNKKKKVFPLLEGKHARKYRRFLLGTAVLFVGTGMVFQIKNGAVTRTDRYHAMTRGMMMTSENPEEAAQFFGIDGSYSLLERSSAYDRYPAIDIQNTLLEEDFYQKYDTGKIIMYYMSHGGTFGKMMQLIVNQAYTVHGSTGGNYDRTAGKEPGAETGFFRFYSTFKENTVPRTLGFLLILLVIFWLLNWKDWWRRILFLYLMVLSVCLMAAVVVRSGAAEAARQLFYYNVVFDMLVFFIAAQFFHWIRGRRKKKKGAV